MGIVRSSIPAAAHSASASVRERSEEKRLGIETAWTRSAPRASAAITATSDESTPPDSPKTTSVKPFLVT